MWRWRVLEDRSRCPGRGGLWGLTGLFLDTDNNVALASVGGSLTLSRERAAMRFDRTLTSIQTAMWRWRVLEGRSRTTLASAHVVQGEGGYGVNRTFPRYRQQCGVGGYFRVK